MNDYIWNNLSQSERLMAIRNGVASGLRDLDQIKQNANILAKGGKKNTAKESFQKKLQQSLVNDTMLNTPQFQSYFTNLARRESGFNQSIVNQTGAKGYFQLMPYNRKTGNQFKDMMLLTKKNIDWFNKHLTKQDYQLMRQKGVDMYGMLASAHLSGPSGALQALRGKSNKRDANGTSALDYMREFSQNGPLMAENVNMDSFGNSQHTPAKIWPSQQQLAEQQQQSPIIPRSKIYEWKDNDLKEVPQQQNLLAQNTAQDNDYSFLHQSTTSRTDDSPTRVSEEPSLFEYLYQQRIGEPGMSGSIANMAANGGNLFKEGGPEEQEYQPDSFLGKWGQRIIGDKTAKALDAADAALGFVPIVSQLLGAANFGSDLSNRIHGGSSNADVGLDAVQMLPYARKFSLLKTKGAQTGLMNTERALEVYSKAVRSAVGNTAKGVRNYNKVLKTSRIAGSLKTLGNTGGIYIKDYNANGFHPTTIGIPILDNNVFRSYMNKKHSLGGNLFDTGGPKDDYFVENGRTYHYVNGQKRRVVFRGSMGKVFPTNAQAVKDIRTKQKYPELSDYLHNSSGNTGVLGAISAVLGHKTGKDGLYYNGAYTFGKDYAVDRNQAIRNRDLIELYLNRNENGFNKVPKTQATPISVFDSNLNKTVTWNAPQYQGNLLPQDTIYLRPESMNAIKSMYNNKKLLRFNTDLMAKPEATKLFPNIDNKRVLDDVGRANISVKKAPNGSYYMDIFDKWDFSGTTGFMGNQLEDKVKEAGYQNGPFILRQKIPVVFTRDHESDGNFLNYISNRAWQDILNNAK